ncbi:DUF3817 domain-containing protein [Pandoraea communis]|uniref:DUF3817 domain-containing protein n=1 Tax=Pandoraea communis TaxID=2508297 RepID=UPI0025A4F63A|nr:DUF3817 domain-containing protein [Pandoraea communis]MDM8355884.1 DUF3817 domain-containing protein [Pandoraea communis]
MDTTAPNLMRNLRIMAAIEATTLVLLVCVAVPLKHLGAMPIAVRWLGPVHGAAFVIYLWMIVRLAASQAWPLATVARLVVTAMVPFAGFTSVVWLARKQATQ